MNKELLKLLGAATGGALLGGGVTYLIVNKRLSKKYADLADEEIESVKRVYKAQFDESLSTEEYAKLLKEGGQVQTALYNERVVKGNTVHAENEVISETRGGDPIIQVQVPSQDMAALQEMLADYNGTEDGPAFARVNYQAPVQDEPADPFFEDRDSREPYLISIDEYMETNVDTYTKAMLTYYEPDQTLVDERNIPVDDIEFTIGSKALENFGNHSGSPDVVYVRKEEGDIDFEITKDPRSYEEVMVGGLPSKDRLRKRDDE